MALLLEAKRLLLEFKPEILNQCHDKSIRVYIRALLEAGSGSEACEPWESDKDAFVENGETQIHQGVLEVVYAEGGIPTTVTATFSQLDFRSFGAATAAADEAVASALLVKTAVLEVRLLAGTSVDIERDVVLGTARLPLRAALGETSALRTTATLALRSHVESDATNTAASPSSLLVDSGTSSTLAVALSASNELFEFMAGGMVLTLGDCTIEAVPSEWAQGDVAGETLAAFSLEVSLQLRDEAIDNEVLSGATPATAPATLYQHATVEVNDNVANSGDSLRNCCLQWVSDPKAPPSLFIALSTVLDLRRRCKRWVLVLALRTTGFTGAARVAATLPVDAVRTGTRKTLRARLRPAREGLGRDVLCCLPKLALPVSTTGGIDISAGSDGGGEPTENTKLEPAVPSRDLLAALASTFVTCSASGGCDRHEAAETWVGMRPSESLRQHLTMLDCVPPKRSLKKKTPRDVYGELEHEIDETLAKVVSTYDALQRSGDFVGCDADQRQRRLNRLLNGDATSHAFRLALTPKIQRVIRKRYPAQPETDLAEQELVGEAYAHMMGVTNALLKRRGCDGVTPSAARNLAEPGLPSEVLGRAFVLACDAEADSRWTVAAAEHKTRLSVAMLVEGTDSTVTASAWFDYCGFVLRARGDAAGRTAFGPNRRATRVLALEGLDEARHALHECLAVEAAAFDRATAKRLQGGVFLEQGRFLDAAKAVSGALVLAAPAASSLRHCLETRYVASNILSLNAGDARHAPLDAAILCIIADIRGHGIDAHRAIVAAARGIKAADVPAAYRPVAALQDAADYLLRWSLANAARAALVIAARATTAAAARVPTDAACPMPPRLVAQRRVLDARLESEAQSAAVLAQEACHAFETADGWSALGDTLTAQGAIGDAVDPYRRALRIHTTQHPNAATPLDLCVKHARCLFVTNQYERARDAYATAAAEWQTSSLWLGAGAAALRLGDKVLADTYLRLATVRAARASLPHAYLALIHVQTDDDNAAEQHASKILDLAMRLGIDDAPLLRELGNSYFQLERYAVAEALLRRAVAAEPKRGAKAHTRKRLADVLAAQNATEDAILQYNLALQTSEDPEECDDITATLQGLLIAVGRSAGI